MDMGTDLKIQTLEHELKEAHLKIERICNWIQLNHGITIPVEVLEPADTNPKQDFNDIFQVIHEEPSPEFCTNDWINSNDNDNDVEINNEDFKDVNTINCTVSSNNSTTLDSLSCKPCLVVIPRIIIEFINDQNEPAVYKRGKRSSKLIPSQEQRTRAHTIYNKIFRQPRASSSAIKCPIDPCPASFTSKKSRRFKLKRHLLCFHYFTEEEFKVPTASKHILDLNKKIKRGGSLKVMPSEEQRTRALTIYHNYSRLTSGPTIQCPICPETTFNSLLYAKSIYKEHLLNFHYLTKEEFHTFLVSFSRSKTTSIIKESKEELDKKTTITINSKFRSSWKISPTEEEKLKAKDMARNFFYDCTVDSVINCPIKSCARTFQFSINGKDKDKNARDAFKKHLILVHFFTNEELHVKSLRDTDNKSQSDLGLGEKKKSCHLCFKVFKFRASLLSHIKFVHEGERPADYLEVPCNICNSKYSTKNALKRHIQAIHLKEKTYLCSYCPQAFAAPQTLKGHLRIHTGEKPYKCDLCDKCFANNAGLYLHKMYQHYSAEEREKLKIYMCDKCPSAKFRLLCHLKKHQEIIHEGFRPHSCPKPNCGQNFKTTCSLKRHINRHSNPNFRKRRIINNNQ